jgi:hypothetical protein
VDLTASSQRSKSLTHLSIVVQGAGKQCVQMRCAENGIGREQLAFVVE